MVNNAGKLLHHYPYFPTSPLPFFPKILSTTINNILCKNKVNVVKVISRSILILLPYAISN